MVGDWEAGDGVLSVSVGADVTGLPQADKTVASNIKPVGFLVRTISATSLIVMSNNAGAFRTAGTAFHLPDWPGLAMTIIPLLGRGLKTAESVTSILSLRKLQFSSWKL